MDHGSSPRTAILSGTMVSCRRVAALKGASLATPRRHIRFTNAARKHGIKRDSIRYVIEHCGRLLYLGDNAMGVPLEVIVVELTVHELLVIHAMPLRVKHLTDYNEATKWRL